MKSWVHINRPSSTRFYGQVRQPGHRLWVKVGPARLSMKDAMQDAVREFFKNKGYWKRGRVIMTADYYDPTVVMEFN